MDRDQQVSSEPGGDGTSTRVPWWRDLAVFSKATAAVTGIVTILAGSGAAGTSYLVERAKLQAQRDSLSAKRLSDSEDRNDRNAAAERELRTKYVDLALQPSVGIERRARIFGYLSTVLENERQRGWASKELAVAQELRSQLLVLRSQKNKAIADTSARLLHYTEAVPAGGWSDGVLVWLKKQREIEQEAVSSYDARIAAIEQGESGAPASSPVPKPTTTSNTEKRQP
ncbi:MAG: hypothetical protein QOH79_3849 [Acidimicrobiaceae bacterium]